MSNHIAECQHIESFPLNENTHIKILRLRVTSFLLQSLHLFFICCLHTNTLTHREEQWVSNQSYNHINPRLSYIKKTNKPMSFYHRCYSLRCEGEERLLEPVLRWQMIAHQSYVASTCPRSTGNGGETWTKHLFLNGFKYFFC